MHSPTDFAQVRAVLLDVEGTTTSVDFVCKTLFPYVRKHLGKFIEERYGSAELAADLQRLRQEHAADTSQEGCPPRHAESRESEIASVTAYIHWLMDRDRKSTALKSIQGKIWEAGYRSGELRSHVYPDVLPAFQRWQPRGKAICIFSSGSILAQKLLFAHSSEGDLCSFIRAYFDTTTGPKNEPESYSKIAKSLRLAPATILFVSDSVAELDAAGAAGMETFLCQRSEVPQAEPHCHAVIRSFAEILP